MQARRQVRRLANDAALLCLARADQVADDDETGGDADTGLQGRVRLERTDGTDQLQSCPNGPLCIILVGLRIAEVHEDAVAHVFRHKPAEAAHDLGDAFLIG